MGELIKMNGTSRVEPTNHEVELMQFTEDLLMDARASVSDRKNLSIPIAELSTLGAGVSSLIPAFNTVSQTTSFVTDNLYRVANAASGDTLKDAINGNKWGALKTATGTSKMAQFAEAGPITATTQTVAAFNPATIMMAAALYSIEKDLTEISETQKKILTFLEVENESQIEADVESLMGIVTNYKYNWDNELSASSGHKLILDIQNRARKNMIAYQKRASDTVSSKQLVVAQSKVNAVFSDLVKVFKYYRLSLYTFSLASLMEIMLSGNFKEEYIAKVEDEIITLSDTYREQFEKASLYLEELGSAGVEVNVAKGIGAAGKVVGKMIGSIPLVKQGPLDEFLQDKGAGLQKNAVKMERKAVEAFAAVSNPGTRVFVEKMEDLILIYNHTSQIWFDNDKVYLLA